jgi:hypothetical protein
MDKVAVGSKIKEPASALFVEQVTMILNRAQHESDDIFLPTGRAELRRKAGRFPSG